MELIGELEKGMRQMSTEIQIAKNQVKLQNWAAQIREYNSSGLKVKQCCAVNGISVKTYYYRLRKVREAMLSENRVAPIGTQQLSDKIEISAEDIRISLPFGCSAETLQTVLRTLKDVT